MNDSFSGGRNSSPPGCSSSSSESSTPRWRTEDIDEHVEKKLAGYEAALGLLEGVITGLRNRVNQLAEENERLKWELAMPVMAPPLARRDTRREELMAPPVLLRGWPDPLLVMEGTDLD